MESIMCMACRERNNPEFSNCWKCNSILKKESVGFKCPKCSCVTYKAGEIRVAGGILGKLFDVEGNRFTALTCEKCSYTEFYKAPSGMLSNIFDLFIH